MQGFSARRGLSQIELLIIVGILVVLGGILIYASGFVQRRFRDDEREQLMKKVTVALEMYKDQNQHYPISGDSVPGGTVVTADNSFNSMAAALGQAELLSKGAFVDPGLGELFGQFNGSGEYGESLKFSKQLGACQGQEVEMWSDHLNTVSYSYVSGDGKTYVMCLKKENGEVVMFSSPKVDKVIL